MAEGGRLPQGKVLNVADPWSPLLGLITQKLWFNSDTCLRELGLKMEEKPNPFVPVEEYSEDNTIQVLVMKYPLIAQSPYREALRNYCALRD